MQGLFLLSANCLTPKVSDISTMYIDTVYYVLLLDFMYNISIISKSSASQFSYQQRKYVQSFCHSFVDSVGMLAKQSYACKAYFF